MITDSGTRKKTTFYDKGDDSTHCVHYVLGLIIPLKLVVKSLNNKKNIFFLKGIFQLPTLNICDSQPISTMDTSKHVEPKYSTKIQSKIPQTGVL